MKFIISVLLFTFIAHQSNSQAVTKTENIILITLDGFRWQELFTGAESRLLLNKKFVADTAALITAYWRETPQQRREILMPFFWNVIAKEGQLYGNRTSGNKVNTKNKMWFSYPGYNEILTGSADDARVTSNDPVNNPNQTVLEFLNKRKEFKGKVAAFSSWETFPWIINTERSGIPVNAGFMRATKNPTESEKLMNELMVQLPNESGGTRADAFTFHYAFEYLKNQRPRVLFISFDETDHFAHEGEYDQYLTSAHHTDGVIKSLWDWIQSDPLYKNMTTLIVTTDHGRGNKNPEDWRHHGSKVESADEVWFAFLGPDVPALGEVKTEQQFYQSQVAKTLAAFLGIDYNSAQKTGDIISSVIKK